MKNPGYFFNINRKTTFFASIKSIDYEELFSKCCQEKSRDINDIEPPSISLCLYEITEDFRFKIILEDDSYAPIPWGYTTKYNFF